MRTITLILACYNGERYVNECFEKSYIDNDDIEYLFVDDGSTDNSAKLAEQFASKHPNNVRVVKRPHNGYTITCDIGIKEASGKFFFFLDVDDWIEKSVLLEALETIKSNPQLDVLLYDYSTDFASGKKSYVTNISKFVKRDQLTCVEEFKKIPLPFYFMNHNILIRTELMKDYEMPDSTLYGDWCFVLYALVHSKQIYYCRKILYHYLIGIKGQTTTLQNAEKYYLEYYKNIKFMDHWFNDEVIKSISRKKRKLIYHSTFLYISNIIFRTFRVYDKQKKNNYVELKRDFKRKTPRVYRPVYYRSLYFFTEKLPKICLTPICKFVTWTLRNQIPWEE